MSQVMPHTLDPFPSTEPELVERQTVLAPSVSSVISPDSLNRNEQIAHPPRQRRSSVRPAASAAELLCLAVVPVLHAIPWLVDGAPWCGLLAIACGFFVVTRRSFVSSFWTTWLWSTIAIASAFYWTPSAMAYTLSSGIVLGTIVAAPLILWDGLRLALGYWLAARIARDVRSMWLPAALATISLELLMPSVFPWRLGFMLLPWTWFTQAVDVFGSSWPTFVAFAAAGIIVSVMTWIVTQLSRSRARLNSMAVKHPQQTTDSRRHGLVAAGVVAANIVYGQWATSYWQRQIDAAPTVVVALVQVDPSYTVSLAESQELTAQVCNDVNLVCWPESSGGSYELGLNELSDETKVFMSSREPERGLRPWPSPTCELVLGGKNYVGDSDEPSELYVTAMLLDEKEQIVSRYNKRFLMPFGEYVPLESTIPGLAALFDMAEHMTPGAKAEVLNSRTGAQLGTMLCYEDMVPAAAREMVHGGANVLVSLINGSAFQSPHTLLQHRLLAQLRALECRRYFLRCAATGETCVISPLGEIVDRIPLQQNGVLKSEVALLDRTTLYSHAPWLAPSLCLLGLAAQIAVVRRPGRRT